MAYPNPQQSEIQSTVAKANHICQTVTNGVNELQQIICELASLNVDINSKAMRKDNAIEGLRGLLRKANAEKDELEMDLRAIRLIEMIEGGSNSADIEKLKADNKALKAKKKKYKRKVKQLMIALDDQKEAEYEDDPDESDPPTSEPSGAEETDISMADGGAMDGDKLLDGSDSDSDSDPDDSDFELDDDDEAELKAEAKDEAMIKAKASAAIRAEMKDEEAEDNDDQEEGDDGEDDAVNGGDKAADFDAK